MIGLVPLLVTGLVAYAIKKSAENNSTALTVSNQENQNIAVPIATDERVYASFSLNFTAMANGAKLPTTATVFFELNRPGAYCPPTALQTIRTELNAVGGAMMLNWATYAPYHNPTEELICLFKGIHSEIVPLSRVIVSNIRDIPPAIKPLELPAPKRSPIESAITELDSTVAAIAKLHQAVIELQKLYPELWDDDETRGILEKRIDHIKGIILTGNNPYESVSWAMRRNARNADL
jgi:hypothetical protein